jgi:hypothetical protein
LVDYLEKTPYAWNTYMLWKDTIPYKHFQHDVDFKITTTYGKFLIKTVLQQSLISNDNFYKNIK